ncbi:hypothetical protein WJX77_009315 [Trebouxia sp. C0004]
MVDEEGRHWRCKRCRTNNVEPLLGTIFEDAVTPAVLAPNLVAAAALPHAEASAPVEPKQQGRQPGHHSDVDLVECPSPLWHLWPLPTGNPEARSSQTRLHARLPPLLLWHSLLHHNMASMVNSQVAPSQQGHRITEAQTSQLQEALGDVKLLLHLLGADDSSLNEVLEADGSLHAMQIVAV